ERAGASGRKGFGMNPGATPRNLSRDFRRSIRSASLRKGYFSHFSRSLLDIESLSDRDIHSLLGEARRFANVSPKQAPLMRRHIALLLTRLGAQVTFCGPPALLPEVAQTIAPGVLITRDFDGALPAADVIMMLRVQKERLSGLQLSVDHYVRDYQLTSERLALAP